MKKTFAVSAIFIVLGLIIGNNIRKFNYNSVKEIVSKNESFYFLQEGVYEKKENLEKNIKNLEQKVVDYQDNKYYVYVGITKNRNIAQKIKKIYAKKGLNLYEKVKTISNEEFTNNVTQFDLLINNSTTDEEILTIEEVVLANYEEILNK